MVILSLSTINLSEENKQIPIYRTKTVSKFLIIHKKGKQKLLTFFGALVI